MFESSLIRANSREELDWIASCFALIRRRHGFDLDGASSIISMPQMQRHCTFRRSTSTHFLSTTFIRSLFSDVTPQNTHHSSYFTISSSSQSPWFPLIRTAISRNDLLFGESIHALVIKHGHTTANRFLTNNLVNMYSKCGSLHSARHLFDIMPRRDLVTWNSILATYASCHDSYFGNVEEGLLLFRLFLRSSDVSLTKLTFVAVLKLCLVSNYAWASECVHGYAMKIGLESNVLISGALVNIYIKSGKVREARLILLEYGISSTAENKIVTLQGPIRTGINRVFRNYTS